MAQELTRRAAQDWMPGDEVNLTWAASDTRALEPDEAEAQPQPN
jgi:hypothetical protein